MSLQGVFSLSHKGEMSHWPNKNTINFSETWNIFKIIYFLKATLIENSSESLRILNMLSFGQYLVNYKFLLFLTKIMNGQITACFPLLNSCYVKHLLAICDRDGWLSINISCTTVQMCAGVTRYFRWKRYCCFLSWL